MQAHLVQLDIRWEAKDANFARVEMLIREASIQAGDLVVLPEMFDTGFSFNLDRTADTDERTLEFLVRLAKKHRLFVHGGRSVLGRDGKGRNRSTIVDPDGRVICEYDKVHPFTFGKETEHFSGGTEIRTYRWTRAGSASVSGETNGLVVQPTICYDLRFPELYRKGLKAGAEVMVITANWPSAREMHRRTLSIARAIENQAFVLSVNRVGKDPTLEYAGGSLVVAPSGTVLGELGNAEGVLSVEIDPAVLHDWRRMFPAWRDLRLI
jgi:predicted amidohydrolase